MGDIKDKYTFVTNDDNPWTCVGIRGGKYDGVVYKYGKVTLPEDGAENKDGSFPFRFEYDIIDPNGLSREFFMDDFFTLIGDVLVDIIDDQIKEDSLEYIDTDN